MDKFSCDLWWNEQNIIICKFKMGSAIEPGNLVSQGYSNLKKTVSMTIVHLRRCIMHIHTVLEGFAYPCEARYAYFAWVCGTPHLKVQGEMMPLVQKYKDTVMIHLIAPSWFASTTMYFVGSICNIYQMMIQRVHRSLIFLNFCDQGIICP